VLPGDEEQLPPGGASAPTRPHYLDVREVGHREGRVGGRVALLEHVAGSRHVLRHGVGVVLDEAPSGGQGVPPGDPHRLGRLGEPPLQLVEEAQEPGGVVTVPDGEEAPQGGLRLAGGDTGRTGGHGPFLQSRVDRPRAGAAG
jgi:hypothetical protein